MHNLAAPLDPGQDRISCKQKRKMIRARGQAARSMIKGIEGNEKGEKGSGYANS
jgi:hypothetical protein